MALKLGELLIQKKMLSKEGLQKGLHTQRIFGGRLGTNLVELGLINDKQLVSVLAQQLNVPAASPGDFEAINRTVLGVIESVFAEKHKIIPISLEPKLKFAISDPRDLEAIDELRFKLGKPIQVVVAPEIWIIAALERYYGIPRETRYVRVGEATTGEGQITYDISSDVNVDYDGKFSDELSLMPFPEFIERLAKAENKEEVIECLFRFMSASFPRMAVYVIKRDGIFGWMVHGFPIHGHEFASVQVSVTGRGLLQDVAESRTEYIGKVPKIGNDQLAFEMLQLPENKEVGVFPILLRGKTIAMVVGSPEGELPTLSEEARKLARVACAKVGFGLELVAVKQQIMHVPK